MKAVQKKWNKKHKKYFIIGEIQLKECWLGISSFFLEFFLNTWENSGLGLKV